MNNHILARAEQQLNKVAPEHMVLAGDDNLIALGYGVIQAGELGVEASRNLREIEEVEENTAAKR